MPPSTALHPYEILFTQEDDGAISRQDGLHTIATNEAEPILHTLRGGPSRNEKEWEVRIIFLTVADNCLLVKLGVHLGVELAR